MDRIQVSCRAANESDTADVIELTRAIWAGHDYVPQVWAEWLADRDGRLIVAEYGGRVIGLTKLSRHEAGAWWLQGLRVHPEFEGRGVAAQLHRAALDAWQEIGDGVLRLSSVSTRLAVHHLCERDGFVKVGERTIFIAQNAAGDADCRAGMVNGAADDIDSILPFEAVTMGETEEAVEFIRRNPAFALQGGLIDLSWEFTAISNKFVSEAIERRLAWWWQSRRGALLAYEDREDDDQPLILYASAVACEINDLEALLADFRRLQRQSGYPGAAWVAPLEPRILAALEANRFARAWEDGIFIFAKEMDGG